VQSDSDKWNPSIDDEKGDRIAEKSSSMSRRRFIAASAATSIGVALSGVALWPVWKFLSPAEVGDEQEKVSVPRSKLGVGQAHFFHFRGRPAVVLQLDPGEFIALSAVCTHLGCIVNWRPEEEIFFCPCHAGKFSRTGQVLGGPPPTPLSSYPLVVKADQVVIG
jgi:cytochrome b6-f complex iron-sulfur subunit